MENEKKLIKRIDVNYQTKGRIYLIKKCTILMLTLTLMLLITSNSTNRAVYADSLEKYSDVTSNHWAISFIDSLNANNIIAGYPDGSFKPQSNVKINEYVVMTVKALGYYYEPASGDWAKPYIDKALELNIIELGQFKNYNDFITRLGMTSITVNAVALTEERPSTEFDQYVANEINDYTSICDLCKQNVLDAYKLGLTTGYSDKTFRPGLFSTRAEATALISKIIHPELRDVPNYDFKTTIKHWYWVKGNGEKVIAETNIKRNGEFMLVDDDFFMPVYKGNNVTEMYALGKYMSTLAAEAGDSPFYVFVNGEDGFGIDAFESKIAYTSIFELYNQQHDQLVYKISKNELIIGASAYLYPGYAYMISLDKKDYEKHRDLIEKMIKFQFKQDAGSVIDKMNLAVATKEFELIKFGINGRNVQISNSHEQIMVEYSVKYN